MATRSQKIRLGVFMLLSFLLLFGSVGVLAGLQLWNPRDHYFVRYKESVSGLEIGSAVKMKGVRVGRVDSVTVAKNTESVIVNLALDPETPVTVDTEAVVASIGITGLKFVELTGGTAKSKRVDPNTKTSEIKAGASIMQTLTGKATDIATKMEAVLNNVLALTSKDNRERITKLLDNTTKLTGTLADIAEQNKKRVRRILAHVDRTTGALERAAASMNKLVTDVVPPIKSTLAAAANASNAVARITQKLKPQAALNEITRAAAALRKRIEDPAITKALEALRESSAMVGKLSKDVSGLVQRSGRKVGSILGNLNAAARHFKAFSRSIRERPSLLLRGETLKEREIK